MTLSELADLLDTDLVITRHPNQKGRVTVALYSCEVKEGDMLAGKYGDATNIHYAVVDYVEKIRGQRLVYRAYSDRRMEVTVPANLTVGDEL